MPKTPALDDQPVRATVRDVLRTRIFNGDYPPGTRLIERDLADEFNVSRLPIREALRMLRQEGLLSDRPRGLSVSTLTPHDVANLFDVREALEVLACRLATERGQANEVEHLHGLVAQAREALGRGAILEVHALDSQFHDSITGMTRNTFLRVALEPLQGRTHWLLRHAHMATLIDEHEQLAAAIASRDPKQAIAQAHRHARKHQEQCQLRSTDR